MTAAELRKAEARYQRAAARAEGILSAATDARNAAIRAACQSMTQRDVAAILGISHGRVGQIASADR